MHRRSQILLRRQHRKRERSFRLGSRGDTQQHRGLINDVNQRLQRVAREIIGPMKILENQHDRLFAGFAQNPLAQSQHCQLLDASRLQAMRSGTLLQLEHSHHLLQERTQVG
jgi:hypothetical protein